MRIMSWNYRGLWGPSIVSQLKESLRLNLPDVVFLSETKQSRGYVGTVCKKLRYENRWELSNLVGRKGGMLVAWSKNITIKQFYKSNFSMEMLVDCDTEETIFWIVFVNASTDAKERQK